MNNIIDLLNNINIISNRKKTIGKLLTPKSESDELKELLSRIPKVIESIYLATIDKDAINIKNRYIYNYFSHPYQTIPGINEGQQYFNDLSGIDNVSIKKYCGIWFTMDIQYVIYYLDKAIRKKTGQLWDDTFTPTVSCFQLKTDIPNMLLLNNSAKYNIEALEEILQQNNIIKNISEQDYNILRNKYISGRHQDTNYFLAAILCRIPEISGWINLQDSDEIFIKSPHLYLELKEKHNITQIKSNYITLQKESMIRDISLSHVNVIDGTITIFSNNTNLRTTIFKDINDQFAYNKKIKENELAADKGIIIIHPRLYYEDTYYCYNREQLRRYFEKSNAAKKIIDDILDKDRIEVDLHIPSDDSSIKPLNDAALTEAQYNYLLQQLDKNPKLHEVFSKLI